MAADLFVPKNGVVVCMRCGQGFKRWIGTSQHGLAHVRRGEAQARLSSIGHRWEFFLNQKRKKAGSK